MEISAPSVGDHMGGVNYVQDGHHRISVAKALGEEYVDPDVIDLDC